MAESIHDWAVKLGMVVDNASISAAEKLMDNFAASTVKSNERIKASNEERARAEQQAQKMREGEKIRQANLSPEDARDERKVRLGGLYAAGAVDAQLFVTELRNINAAYAQQQSAIAATAAAEQAASAQAIRNATFNREQRREANDRWKESIDAAGRASATDREAATQRENLDRQQATRTAAFNRDQRRAANDTWKYQQDQIGARAANARAAAAEAAQVARVNALLQQYGNHAENVAADIAFLNAAHQRGAISTQQHGVAIAEATRRMNAMRGGAGNMGYAIGELARGAEDFITVMSITGFKAESVGMAMRGAGNNISQATNLIVGPLAGAAVGVAAILGGQLVSSLMRSEEETSNWNKALKETTERLEAIAKFKTSELETSFAVQDVGEDDAFKNSKGIRDGIREMKILKSQINEGEESMRAFNGEMLNLALGNGAAQELENVFKDFGKLGFGELEVKFRNQFKNISDDMAEQINKGIAPEAAFETFKERMRLLNNEMRGELLSIKEVPGQEFSAPLFNDPANVQAQIDALEQVAELDEEGKSRLKELIELRQNLAAIEAIQAERKLQQEAKESALSVNTLEALYEKLELAHATNEAEELALTRKFRLNELQKEYGALGAFGLDLANKQLAAEIELEEALKQKNSLKEQETENENKLKSLKKDLMDVDELRMLERMTAEERKAYEWAKKRAEIMITGAASPGELEKIFAQQANFRMAEIDLEFKKSAPAYQTAGSSLAQTTASMNSEILRGMGQTKDKDMISELKAIKEALTGARGVKLVEVD